MSESRKVWPKEALGAERNEAHLDVWNVELPTTTGQYVLITDAEFAATFVDAAVLTELIDEVRVTVECVRSGACQHGISPHHAVALATRLAAFDDAVMFPDTETQ